MSHRAFLSLASSCVLVALGCGKSEPAAAPAAPTPAPTAAQAPTPSSAPPAAEAEASGGFEGEVGLKASSSKPGSTPTAFTLSVKGKRLRFALPKDLDAHAGNPQMGAPAYVVIDGAQKRVVMVSDERKTAMVFSLDKLGEQMKQMMAAAPPAADPSKPAAQRPEMKKTGKTDTVAGRSCDEWEVVNEDKTKLRACIAEEETSWLQLPDMGLSDENAWASELFDGKRLPLRAIAFEASGKEKGRVEVTRIEPKPLDASLFAPPEGYKVIDLGEMMRGMSQMMGGAMPPGAMPPGAGGQMPGAMPPGMAGKLPPNFQEMMAKMRERMQAMKAAQPPGAGPDVAGRAQRKEQLAEPPKPAEKAATTKTSSKAKEKAAAKTEKPAATAKE